MIKHQFSDFSYAVNNDSAKKGQKEILVCFMYNGTEVLKKIYIPEKAGTAYVFEAKKIIDQEMRDGTLSAYAHKFVAKNKKKDASSKPKTSSSSSNKSPEYVPVPAGKGLKIAFVIVCVLLAGAVAAAVMFMLKKPPVQTEKVAITFDGNGGSWTTGQNIEHSKTITVDKGTKWSQIEKPVSPTLEGNTFEFWTIDGHVTPADDYVFDKSVTTVNAIYDANSIWVTFDKGEHGQWKDPQRLNPYKFQVTYGTTFADIKESERLIPDPITEDYKFIYFTDGTINNSPLGDSYKFTGNEGKFVAQYVVDATLEVQITADANGGTWDDYTGNLLTLTFDKGDTWGEVKQQFIEKINQPDGYTDTDPSWQYFKNNAWAELTDNIEFASDTQIKAVYTPNKLDIVFDAGEGTWPDSQPTKQIQVDFGSTFAEYTESLGMPIPPETEPASYFVYFQYEEEGVTKNLSDSYIFKSSDSFKAYYEKITNTNLIIDANGGKVDGDPIKLDTSLPIDADWQTIATQLGTYAIDAPTDKQQFDAWEYYDGSDWVELPTTGAPESDVIRIRATYEATSITVNFDSGDGTWANPGETGTRSFTDALYGQTFGEFKADSTHTANIAVTPPARKTFLYFADEENKVVSEDYVLVDGATYTAQYIQVASDYVSVTIDPQNGKISGSTEALMFDVYIGKTWADVLVEHPEIETLEEPEGHTFDGWYYFDGSDWTEVTNDYQFNSNTYIKAVYTIDTITVTFTSGVGTWTNGEQGPRVAEDDYGITFAELEAKLDLAVTAQDEYHAFTHFAIIPASGDPVIIGPSSRFTDNVTVVAQYVSTEDVVDLNIDLNGGTIAGETSFDLQLVSGTTWGQLEAAYGHPEAPTGQQLVNFVYDTDIEVTPNTVFDGTITSIKALYEDIPPVRPASFETDDWGLFTSVFNQGFTFASTTPHNQGGYSEEFTEGGRNTFVGLTRTVTIGDTDYEVKVIDEKKDILSGTLDDTAALTFEFTNAVNDAVSFSTYKDNSRDYENSNLRKTLNGNIYDMLPDDLRTNIKEVKKWIYDVTSGIEIPTTKTVNDKLFSLSLSEMGITTLPDDITPVLDEGSVYKAYQGLVTTDYIKTNTTGDKVNYWVRSSVFDYDQSAAWCFNEDGEVGLDNPESIFDINESCDVVYGLAVVPAFCIGIGA